MKFVNKILLLNILILLLFSGCNDEDFLQEEPKDLFVLDNAFEKSSQVEAQLTMCYYGAYGEYAIGNDVYRTKTIGSDVLDEPYWRNSGAGGFSNFNTWLTTSTEIETLWNFYYQLISYANLTLYGTEVETITWSDEDYKNKIIAEAKFFRGLAYLRLAEAFGGVPIVLEFTQELRFDYTRSSREETYQQAIEDLLVAYQGLPDYPEENGRVARGAAANYLAEAYLAIGVETNDDSNYSSAIQYAQETIALHPLMTERFGIRSISSDLSSNRGVATYLPEGNVFGDLFYMTNYDYSAGNTEAVWTLKTPTYEELNTYGVANDMFGYDSPQYTEQAGYAPVPRDINWADGYSEEGSAAGPWKNISAPYATAMFPAYLGGFGLGATTQTEYAAYTVWTDTSDIRYEEDVTVRTLFECTDANHSMFGKKVPLEMINPDPSQFTKYAPLFSKLVPFDEWPYESTDNFHLRSLVDAYGIRSSESYLLLAEAYLRDGQAGLAADAVNVIRNRAKCETFYTASDIDINSILDERIRELMGEEGRWFTLLRMEPEVWKQRLYDHAMYIEQYPIYTREIPWNLFPIPQSYIDLNTGAELTQNEGWD